MTIGACGAIIDKSVVTEAQYRGTCCRGKGDRKREDEESVGRGCEMRLAASTVAHCEAASCRKTARQSLAERRVAQCWCEEGNWFVSLAPSYTEYTMNAVLT
jgi:hypothetical protein